MIKPKIPSPAVVIVSKEAPAADVTFTVPFARLVCKQLDIPGIEMTDTFAHTHGISQRLQ